MHAAHGQPSGLSLPDPRVIESPPVQLRRGTPADAAALSAFGRRQFAETFGADNRATDLAAYLDRTYSVAAQGEELADARLRVLVAEVGGSWAGYALAGQRAPVPACVVGEAPWQLERFYVDRAYHGQGLADALMDAVLEVVATEGGQQVWLTVWEHNARAIGFYRRRGFAEVGSTVFTVGASEQVDRVLARPVRDRRTVPLPRSTVRRPALVIRMQRGTKGRDFVAVVRADGSSSWLRRPGGAPRRDRALIAVETTLNVANGVLARLAGGAELAEFLAPEAIARPDAAGWSMRLAAVLDADEASPQLGGAATVTAATVAAALGPAPAGVPALSDGMLLALRGELARLERSWCGLAAGDALEFPVGLERLNA